MHKDVRVRSSLLTFNSASRHRPIAPPRDSATAGQRSCSRWQATHKHDARGFVLLPGHVRRHWPSPHRYATAKPQICARARAGEQSIADPVTTKPLKSSHLPHRASPPRRTFTPHHHIISSPSRFEEVYDFHRRMQVDKPSGTCLECHIPRLEDWPVMPVECIGFMLMISITRRRRNERKEAKMRHLLQQSRTSTSTKDLHQKARSSTVSENKRTFITLSLHQYQ